MPFQTWEEVVRAAALGDDEASDLMAGRLAEIDKASDTVETVRQQARAELNLFQRNSATLQSWRHDNPHLANDDELFARMVEIDSDLATKHPELTFEQRLVKAESRAVRELGDPEERDNPGAVEQLRRARAGYRADPSTRAQLNESDTVDYGSEGSDFDPAETEIETQRSIQIALLANDRKPKALSEEYIQRRREADQRSRVR